MTIIASWINKEDLSTPSIWTVGDTKACDTYGGSLSLINSKVFEINIRCYEWNTFKQKCYYEHSVGYAYAGSSLVGLNVFSTLSTVLINLDGWGKDKHYPTLEGIMKIALKFVNDYAETICSVHNSFEALIYGFCPKKEELIRYYIYKNPKTPGFLHREVGDENEIILLGDKKNEILEKIHSDRHLIDKDNSVLKYHRSPLKTIDNIIDSSHYNTIGGGTQLNIANKCGCKPYQAVRGITKPKIEFRNIDINSNGCICVGDCIVNIPGLWYEQG